MSKRDRGYQIDKITHAKGGGTLNAYMRAEGGCEKERKIDHKICSY